MGLPALAHSTSAEASPTDAAFAAADLKAERTRRDGGVAEERDGFYATMSSSPEEDEGVLPRGHSRKISRGQKAINKSSSSDSTGGAQSPLKGPRVAPSPSEGPA
jgi:hypothetical protein